MKRVTKEELAALVPPVGDVVIDLTYGVFRGAAVGVVVVLDGIIAAAKVELADGNGAPMVFKDAGSAIDFVTRNCQVESGSYSVLIESSGYLLKALPVDVITVAKSRKKALIASRARSVLNAEVIAGQKTAMTAFGVVTAAQVALFGELGKRADCLASELVSIDQQIAKLTAIIPPAVP